MFLKKLFARRIKRRATPLSLGRRGEQLAVEYLERIGYRIVAVNFETPVGRNLRGAMVRAEIDIIAYEGPTLCFIEVKTRASMHFAAPERNVDLRKQRQISRAARAYRRLLGLENAAFRFDVVSIIWPDKTNHAASLSLQLFRNFWIDRKPRPGDTGNNFYVE